MARFVRVISVDGGGVRALVPAVVLAALEDALRRITGDPDTALADHVDLVAGASSGALLAAFLLAPTPGSGRPRYRTEEAVARLRERSPEIFHLSLWQRFRTLGGTIDERYSAEGLERVLREHFGELRLAELLRPTLFPTYDIESRRAVFLTQHDARTDPARDYPVRAALRAATAAPTYFEAPRIASVAGEERALIDGGLFANNPALAAFAEARKLVPACTPEHMVVLSLGTGAVKRAYPQREARNWGLTEWARPAIEIAICGVSETVDYELAQLFAAVERPGQYLRLQTELGEASPDLDDASPRNLAALEALGQALARTHTDTLERFATQLLAD